MADPFQSYTFRVERADVERLKEMAKKYDMNLSDIARHAFHDYEPAPVFDSDDLTDMEVRYQMAVKDEETSIQRALDLRDGGTYTAELAALVPDMIARSKTSIEAYQRILSRIKAYRELNDGRKLLSDAERDAMAEATLKHLRNEKK